MIESQQRWRTRGQRQRYRERNETNRFWPRTGAGAKMRAVESSDKAGNQIDSADVARSDAPVARTSDVVSLKSRLADSLDVHGGFVLLGSGIGLIALACVFDSKTDVAPIFAVFGALLIILAAFYSRIEGNVEATKEGVKMTVRDVQRRSREKGLSREGEEDAVERAIDRLEIPSRTPSKIRQAGEIAAAEAVESVAEEARRQERWMLSHFAQWLEDSGDFTVIRTNVRTPQGWEYDLIADGPEQVLIAEASLH